MNKYLPYIIFAFLFILYACESKEEISSIKIEEHEIKPINQEDIIEDVYRLKLNYPDTVIIGSISRLLFNGLRLFLYDQGQSTIFIFDNKGNYQNKIFSIGSGPGEYAMIHGISLYNNEGIAIADLINSKVMFFQNNGNLLKEERLDENLKFQEFICIGRDEYFFLVNGRSGIKFNNAGIVYNNKDNYIILNEVEKGSNFKFINFNPYIFTNSTGSIFYHSPFSI